MVTGGVAGVLVAESTVSTVTVTSGTSRKVYVPAVSVRTVRDNDVPSGFWPCNCTCTFTTASPVARRTTPATPPAGAKVISALVVWSRIIPGVVGAGGWAGQEGGSGSNKRWQRLAPHAGPSRDRDRQ